MKNTIKLIGIAVGILLVSVGLFFVVYSPIKAKQRLEAVKPVFSDHYSTSGQIVDFLNKDSDFDSEAIERDATKGKNLLEKITPEQKTLTDLANSLNGGSLKTLKGKYTEYLATSQELIDLHTNGVKLMEEYVSPIKDYEELTLEMSGAGNYMYSDPDKYASIIGETIKKEQAIVDRLKAIELTGEMADYNHVFIKNYESEIAFLEKIKTAVDRRDVREISDAEKTYAESMQKIEKEGNRIEAKIEDKVEELKLKLEDLQKDIEEETDKALSSKSFLSGLL